MALQIRRGTDTQRQALSGPNTPIAGELLYSTDNKKLYIGDGTTTGGTSIGYFGSVAVSGQSTIRSTGTNEALTIVAGANISLITDANTGTLTIAAAPQELTNGSLRLFQNNITSLNSNEDINIDPAGSGKVNVTGNLTATTLTGNLTGNVSGNVTGNVTGNAGTVTNGIYTTDTATVTNTMLAGSIANNKLDNSSITVGSTSISLGSSSTTLSGLTSVTSSVVFADEVNNQRIKIRENVISTLSSNENIEIDFSGTGYLNVSGNVQSKGLNIFSPGGVGESGTGQLVVTTQSTTLAPIVVFTAHNTASYNGGTTFVRARGGLLAPSIVQNGDILHNIVFNGHNGTTTLGSSAITASVDSIATTSAIPGRLTFSTANTAGTFETRLTVNSTAVTSAVPVKLAVYADATARDAAVTSPTAGMVVFNTTGTKFQGYTGSAWVDLN